MAGVVKDQVADVDLSVDGGQTWSNIWHHTVDSVQGGGRECGPVPGGRQARVQVRFHFTASFGVVVAGRRRLPGRPHVRADAGGLVVGQVLDKNTGAAINGASVTSADQPAEKATSTATPDDPNLGDGFYWMFSSVTGSHTFTATANNYSTQDADRERRRELRVGRHVLAPRAPHHGDPRHDQQDGRLAGPDQHHPDPEKHRDRPGDRENR